MPTVAYLTSIIFKLLLDLMNGLHELYIIQVSYLELLIVLN